MATTLQLLSDLKHKKLRDVVRLSAQANHSKMAETLSQGKDAIGDWHDWQELARLADGSA